MFLKIHFSFDFFLKCSICQKTVGICTRSGPIPHAIRTNPLPCQKKAVILHSHSALGSHSRYRSTKSAGDQGLCSPQKSEIFGGPKKDASHAHRTFIALPSHTRTRVAAMSPAGGPIAPRRVPGLLWAVQERIWTQIISAANKQYKGRKSLRLFQ